MIQTHKSYSIDSLRHASTKLMSLKFMDKATCKQVWRHLCSLKHKPLLGTGDKRIKQVFLLLLEGKDCYVHVGGDAEHIVASVNAYLSK